MLFVLRVLPLLVAAALVVWAMKTEPSKRRREAVPAEAGGYLLLWPDTRRYGVGFAILFPVLAVFAILEHVIVAPIEDLPALLIIKGAFFAFAVLLIITSRRPAVRIDDGGLHKLRILRSPKSVSWDGGQTVDFLESPFPRLVVRGHDGTKFSLGFELDGHIGVFIMMREKLTPEMFEQVADKILKHGG